MAQGFRPTAVLLRQVALSVAATLIATALVSGMRGEWALVRPSETSGPTLTSGGKFAARVEALTLDADNAIGLPRVEMPRPVLASLPAAAPAHTETVALQLADLKPAEIIRPKRPSHAEATTHRRPIDIASVLPPRRVDFVSDQVAATSTDAEVHTSASGLWSATKGLLGQTAALSGAMIERVVPSGLLP